MAAAFFYAAGARIKPNGCLPPRARYPFGAAIIYYRNIYCLFYSISFFVFYFMVVNKVFVMEFRASIFFLIAFQDGKARR